MKQAQVFQSLGETVSVGWLRDDVPSVVHVFAQCKPGERFQPSNGAGGPHWPCKVCEAHGYTEDDFHAQMGALCQ